MALDLSTLSAEQQVAAIYIGYYDRAADPVGQNFWEGAVANPALSLADIATDFSTQPETLNVHPFFDDPTPEAANAFITELYLNLFNREPDTEGLTFWSDALQSAIAGEEGAISVGEIILAIIEGAQDTEAGADRTTILNKIEVSNAWTDAAESAGIDYTSDTGAQNSAKSIIEGVTNEGSTVTSAKSTIDNYFEPQGTPGETFSFTSGTDNLVGTDDDDTFEGYLQQNPFAGGVSNGLSSADRADGGAGEDSLYAEMVSEFVGGVSGTENIDVQPRIKNIETLEFEARDIAQNAILNIDIQDLAGNLLNDLGFGSGIPLTEQNIAGLLDGWQRDIVIDAKNITGHDFLGSTFSDGDLLIENVNTLTSGGAVRNTSDITIGMDHTDNANSDGDASDLTVYFDEDYLISGQAAEGKVFYFLLDEDAELAGNPNRLNNIDVDGIRFNITNADGSVTEVNIEADAANTAGTHQGFVNALQDPLQALIADGTLPAGTTLTLDPTVTDVTFLDNGAQSDLIPAIVLTSGDGSVVEATGFSRIEEEIGEYDVYGRFNSVNEVEDQPVSVNIDLFKAGRGGEGGNLVIGGKDQTEAGDGIEVFYVNVKGDGPDAVVDQPSNIGTLTSTNNALREIYISTDATDAVKDSVASLTIRDGFNELYDGDSAGLGSISGGFSEGGPRESGDLQLVNADSFLGDLNLGTDEQIINLDTLTAQGGGDVYFDAWLNGTETDQAYSYTTGGGDDEIYVEIDGDATDFAGSSLNVSTGAGNDIVDLESDIDNFTGVNQQLNQNILDNVMVDTGAGDDTYLQEDILNANVMMGSGNDTIYSDGDDGETVWAMNFDAVRALAQGGIGNSNAGNLPGEQVSLAYLGGAQITVTLSGPGIAGNLAAGGGVMAVDGDVADGANRNVDGYESTVTIGNNLVNGNRYYGDQRDVNAAILDAINNDPVLSKLLVASIGSNNTVVISALVEGAFADVDLRVDINQRASDAGTYADAVLSEARSVFSNSALVTTDLFAGGATGAYLGTGPGADLATDSNATDAWYDGLSQRADTANNAMSAAVGELASNLHTTDTPDVGESDGVFDGGSGNDVIVLSTDATENTPIDFTVSSNNALINGASNETVKLTGMDIGNDTVMNFTTFGAVNQGPFDTAPVDPTAGYEGLDFLDFTSYLTSRFDSSSNPPGSDSSVSNILIPVTLDYNETDSLGGTGDGAGNALVEANEVAVVRLATDGAESETYGTLTASVIANLFNGTVDDDDEWGGLAESEFGVQLYSKVDQEALIGDGKAILMVENDNNLGDYKVFELTWNGSNVPSANGDVVTAVLLGELDFGDSLTNLDDINLVGSEDHAALLNIGFA